MSLESISSIKREGWEYVYPEAYFKGFRENGYLGVGISSEVICIYTGEVAEGDAGFHRWRYLIASFDVEDAELPNKLAAIFTPEEVSDILDMRAAYLEADGRRGPVVREAIATFFREHGYGDIGTGGGCEAWSKELPEGYVMISDEAQLPETWDDPCLIMFQDKEDSGIFCNVDVVFTVRDAVAFVETVLAKMGWPIPDWTDEHGNLTDPE